MVPGSVPRRASTPAPARQGSVAVMLPDLTGQPVDANRDISATDTVPVSQQPQGPR
jgi:hypothetical protein